MLLRDIVSISPSGWQGPGSATLNIYIITLSFILQFSKTLGDSSNWLVGGSKFKVSPGALKFRQVEIVIGCLRH